MTQLDNSRFLELIKTAREENQENNAASGGINHARQYSEKMIEAVQFHVQQCLDMDSSRTELSDQMVILAVGGFGRLELNLFSDIDFLLLFDEDPTPKQEDFIRDFLYPFWEAKVKPSYMIKTLPQLIEEWDDDLDLITTLMSSQIIWGSEDLADRMMTRLRYECSMGHAEILTGNIKKTLRARHRKFSDTAALLEPNVKSSPGGLRDIHSIYWLTFVLYNRMDFESLVDHGIILRRDMVFLRDALNFLIRLRNEIHSVAGSEKDQLSVEFQIKIAPQLGYENSEQSLPEEQLLRTYYEHAEVVLRILNKLFGVVESIHSEESTSRNTRMRGSRIEGHFWHRDGELWLDPQEIPSVTRDSSWLLHLFITTTLYDLVPSDDTLDLVAQHRHEVDDVYRLSAINRERFLMILRHPKNSGRALRYMHKSRFLESFIPEFSAIRHLPRIDYYHRFTVDEHLIRAVECCNDYFVKDSPSYDSHAGHVAREILRADLLNMAILLHDIGKGEGRGHVIRGAHTMQRVCQRLAMRDVETRILHDLVAHHHRLSTVTLNRNAEDPGVPQQLARDIRSPELFKMLYVLTCCDLRAVSEESWNDWRATLLAQMYERTMNSLMPHRKLADNNRVVELKLPELASELVSNPEQDSADKQQRLREFVLDMPDRYCQSTPPEQIARHFEMAGKLSEERPLVVELETTVESNYSIFHCLTRNSPSLFRNVCGALSSRCLQIRSAQIYTGKTGVCVDVYQVQDERGRPVTSPDLIERIEQKLREVHIGDKDVDWVLPTRQKSNPISSDRLSLRPPSVTIFNEESSENFSILEIRAPDRPGLLYDITTVLEKFRVHVHIALIATESYQVIDVFYVTDWDNNRLHHSPMTENLRKELLEIVSPDSSVLSGEP